MKSKMNEPKVF